MSRPSAPTRAHTEGRRLRLRSLILLVVLVPTLGMVGIAATSARDALDERDATRRIASRVDTLAALADARATLVDERSATETIVFAAAIGFDQEAIAATSPIDYVGQMHAARDAVDADQVLQAFLPFVEQRDRLLATRGAVDEEEIPIEQVQDVYGELIGALDARWGSTFLEVQDELASSETSAALHDRATALQTAFAVQQLGTSRMGLATELALAAPDDPSATIVELVRAGTRYRALAETIPALQGPATADVLDRLAADPAVVEFEDALDEIEVALVTGSPVPALSDLAVFEEVFIDAEPWGSGLGDLVRSTATDLRAEATHQQRRAERALEVQVAVAGVMAILTSIGAVLLTRSLTRPVRALEEAAREIRGGTFDREPIDPSGPRELADTATAFNEMTHTLASVETYARTLADEPDDPLLDHAIPGRTGQALQVALNRLRASIRQAGQRREELEVVATHDSLTKLLNRSAALMMIGRDLAAAERGNGAVMALFIDLDEFKPINDRHGHAAGDDALRLVADALRRTTRDADVVARIGGDEFLVAGVVGNDPGEVERLAERIRDAITSTRLGTEDGPIGLQCSIGMAMSAPGDDVDVLVQRADSAMYVAKQRGGNRIAWARPRGSTTSRS